LSHVGRGVAGIAPHLPLSGRKRLVTRPPGRRKRCCRHGFGHSQASPAGTPPGILLGFGNLRQISSLLRGHRCRCLRRAQAISYGLGCCVQDSGRLHV
jgi:hypothetical protein